MVNALDHMMSHQVPLHGGLNQPVTTSGLILWSGTSGSRSDYGQGRGLASSQDTVKELDGARLSSGRAAGCHQLSAMVSAMAGASVSLGDSCKFQILQKGARL